MRGSSDLRLPLLAAAVFAVLGAAWFFAAAAWAPHERLLYGVSAGFFVIVGTISIYAIVQRGVAEHRVMVEDLLGREQRSAQRRKRLDILWRFAGSELADFSAHATAALEVSTRVLGLEYGEAAHVEGNALVCDLFHSETPSERPQTRDVATAAGRHPIEAGKTVSYSDLNESGVRAYIATPFSVGNLQYELGFWSASPREAGFDDEDLEYVQVLAGFFAGLFRQRRQEEQLAHLALFDALTGLANRQHLLDRLRSSIAAHRRRDAQCALLVIDLNRFKQVNDVLGHAAGDAALMEIAERLKNVLRAEDSLARIGSDRFAVITSLMKSPAEVVALAERLRDASVEPLKIEDHTFHISSSVGISVFPTDGVDPKSMLDHAGAAANRAKEEGSGRYKFYSNEISQSVRSRQELFNDLRNAVNLGEFALHFQPQVDLRTGATVGAEALLRWQHGRRGMVDPSAFVPAAEENGLMVPIGTWVLQQALLQWRPLVDFSPSLHLGINVSARQFGDPDFYELLSDAIEAARVAPDSIVIEITETVAMANPAATRATLLRCKERGLMVALDDFGTLYSSLAYLKTLPIDIVKIDKSFVDGLPHDHFDGAIVHAVISLADALGCSIVAEGVETREQAQWLAEAGCQSAQGFLYSKGLPYDEFVNWMRRERTPAV
ncbi:MAG: bifunctional diguanylate cyclase/phosphodiesterase [Candidatus Eremiobacteraeota bacterium]|nr:bifunctional diguanylate cyclase/phosphodiesterase [Candidatus Eremiobacteraeota bacterium]